MEFIAGSHATYLYLGVVVRRIAAHLAAPLDYLVDLFQKVLDFIVRLLLRSRPDRLGAYNYRMLFRGVWLFAGERSAAVLGLLVQGKLLGLVLDQVVQRNIEKGEAIERGSGSRLVGDSWFGGGDGRRLLLRCGYVEATIHRLGILLSIEVARLLVVSTEYVISRHLLQRTPLLVAWILRSLEFVVLP
jgi:hypothetical protein